MGIPISNGSLNVVGKRRRLQIGHTLPTNPSNFGVANCCESAFKLKALQIAMVVQAKEIYIPMAHATEVEVDIVVSVKVEVQVGVEEREVEIGLRAEAGVEAATEVEIETVKEVETEAGIEVEKQSE